MTANHDTSIDRIIIREDDLVEDNCLHGRGWVSVLLKDGIPIGVVVGGANQLRYQSSWPRIIRVRPMLEEFLRLFRQTEELEAMIRVVIAGCDPHLKVTIDDI